MIELRQISKSYAGVPVLREVSLQVQPGEALALVGPNGAGKSTTLRVIAGIIRPDSGVAMVDGLPAEDPAARERMGYLPQKPGVPASTSLLSLVRLVAEVRGLSSSAGREVLESVGLADRSGASLSQLSGGQRQRLMLALATLGPVSALLLDEPGISLDADGAQDVHARIRDAKQRGTAVLFASHHLADVASLADRMAIMVGGAVAAQGTLGELARRAGISSPSTCLPPIETVYRLLVTRHRRPIREVA
jgi:ABC-type multidrug transport system ATPase subunit